MSQFEYESPDQSAANGLSRGERWAQTLRGIGWVLLTITAYLVPCALPAWLAYLGVRWVLAHMYEYPRVADAINFTVSALLIWGFWE